MQGHLYADKWEQNNKSGPGVLQVLHESLASPHDIFVLHFGLW